MKKFDNYIIEKPCDSNSDKLQKILIIESLVDDIGSFLPFVKSIKALSKKRDKTVAILRLLSYF